MDIKSCQIRPNGPSGHSFGNEKKESGRTCLVLLKITLLILLLLLQTLHALSHLTLIKSQ